MIKQIIKMYWPPLLLTSLSLCSLTPVVRAADRTDAHYKALCVLYGLDQDRTCCFKQGALSCFKNCTATYCNRGFIDQELSIPDLGAAKTFYASHPHTLWANKAYSTTHDLLVHNGYKKIKECPLMKLDLATLIKATPVDGNFSIEICNSRESLQTWAGLIVRNNAPEDSTEEQRSGIAKEIFTDYLYIQNNTPAGNVQLTLGLCNGIPVATGRIVRSDDIVAVHNITTQREYRRRGIGSAMTHHLLSLFKDAGAATAYLFASELGYPVYEKLGFKTIANYEIFGVVNSEA